MTYRAILFCKNGSVTGNNLAHYKFDTIDECVKLAKMWLKYDKIGDGYKIISSNGDCVCEVIKD